MARDQARSKPPAIVAELGRPETPSETAARKAEASRRHRANQNTLNLVVALLASLGVVLFLVLVVVRPSPPPREPIDYAATAADAQPLFAEPLAIPQLPDGWAANAARVEKGADGVRAWYVGFLTPSEEFVGMRQGEDANASWVAAGLEGSFSHDSRVLGGVEWQLYDPRDKNSGSFDRAMSATFGRSTVVLSGTASEDEFNTLATTISSQLGDPE